MLKRIGVKLILVVGVTALTILGLFAYLSLQAMEAGMLAEVELHATQLSETVRASTRYAMLLNERDHIRQIVHSIGLQEDIGKVRVMNKLGEIIYSSVDADIGTMVDKRAESCYSCHSADRPWSSCSAPDVRGARRVVHTPAAVIAGGGDQRGRAVGRWA